MGQPQSHALSVEKNVVAFSMGDVCCCGLVAFKMMSMPWGVWQNAL